MLAKLNRGRTASSSADRASTGRRTNLTILLLAIVCGIASTIVITHFIQQAINRHNQPSLEPVVTAVRDVSAHTVIQPSDVAVKQIAVSGVTVGAATSLSQVVGRYTASHWYAGQQVIAPMVVSSAQQAGFPLSIPVGKRAFTINDDPVTGVDHLISTGDNVDVVASTQSKNGPPVTRLILFNIRVLNVDHPPAPAVDSTTPTGQQVTSTQTGDTVTLSVSPDEAKILDNAIASGTIRLILRNPTDSN